MASKAEERWRRFTPRSVDTGLCLARTWKSGQGGQCTKRPADGSEFCAQHKEGWKVHGRVDGTIPDKKLQEFEKVASAASSRTKPGTGAKASSPGAASAETKADAAVKQAETADSASPSKRRKLAAAAGAASAEADSAAGPSSSTVPPASTALPSESKATGSREAATASEGKANVKAARRPEARKAKSRPVVGKAKPGAKATAKSAALPKPTRVRCTCGKPIHTEKCKMFRAGFLHKFASKAPRQNAPPPPQSPRKKTLPPPSVRLSEVAAAQVSKISQDVASVPKAQRKAAWKKQMRMYHPDKQAVFPHLSEAQMNEVFVEIKRRYDFSNKNGDAESILPARFSFAGRQR
eukprot:TRINITY_DN12712_c0_g1_i2.p1 TRINITY_DN12712_c0_g1~~TRINITY_DN12712_c0_g1_i2.p1  ORF type:complete len:351 (-),score=79.09 TRINITY_DN12712_c0_g1_i2:17-1069(-)